MKYLPTIAGIVLGLLFLMASGAFFLNLVSAPPIPEGTPAAMFLGAIASTGYLAFVKALELIGAILVAIPRTRNLGLLVLGPIIVNILAHHLFIMKGEGLFHPMMFVMVLPALYLLWVERKAFAGLIK